MASNSSGIKLGRAYVLIDAVDRTKQACNAALRNISTLADNVMAIGTNMTIAASIAVTLDASASRAFREFEDTMLKVKAKSKDTAGATVAAYDQLIQKAQELGRVTRFTAPQVAEAMAGMAAAGLSRSTIDKSIKNVLDLAIATGVEIPTASRIAMAAMQQFNMTAEQSAEICDVLSAAVNNSALNLEDIGETFKYAAPLAKEFGMDIKQLSVVIAALGNAGIKGSQAGTSLRQMMTKLAKPGEYDLEAFNKDFEANVQRDIVVNVGGVLRKRTRPVLDILRDMGKSMDEFEKKHPDIDPQKKLSVFATLFGRYAMTAGSTLSDNMKNLDTMMRAINNSSGTAGKTAEIMNSGIGGMHAAFISAWQDVAIQYGKALNDTVKTFYSAFTRIAHVISSFIQNNKQIISVVTASTAATAGLGVAMMVSAAAVKTFAVVGGTFTSVVGTMTSAAYGFAIALNGWISPLISAQGLLRGLTATAASLVIPIRSVAGVIGSFAPRWNLPWREAPAGARRLTASQARNASGLLSSYYARSLAEGMPAGVLHSELAARESARVAAIARSLTHEGQLETLNDRVRNPRLSRAYRGFHEAAIARTAAADALRTARSTEHAKEVRSTVRGQARDAVKTITGKHKEFLDLAKEKEKEINEQYKNRLSAIKKGSSNEAIKLSDRAEARAFNAYNAARTTRMGLEHNRRVYNKAIGMEQMLLASGRLGEAETKLAQDKIKSYKRTLASTNKGIAEIRAVEDKALQKYQVHKAHGLELRDKYEPAVANRIRRLDASRDAALAAVAARRTAAATKVAQYKEFAKTGYKATVERKLEREIARAERSLTRATSARDAATTAMRAETVRRRGAAPRRRTIYDPWLALNSPNERMSTRLVGQRGWRSTNFLRAGMTTDYGRNAQYLRERMRMLRLAGFHDLTRNQALMRSAELIRTRRLITSNNMALGRARWGNFFRPFTDAMRRATRAVGEFSMRLFGSISRIGLHPLRGMRSMLGWAGSSLFAGLAPGGGIMKGIGAMFSASFKAIRAMGMPVLRGIFNLMVRIATAPLTWVAGLTAATLATGNLKNVLAGVYIGISAIGVGISKIYEQAKKVFSWIAERFVENMKQANAIIDPVLNLWKTSFVRIGSDVKSAFGTITRSIGAGRWGDAFKMLGATWNVIKAELSAVLKANWEHMKLTFMTSWNRVVDYFQSGAGVWGIVRWLVTNLWNVTKWVVGELYKAITTFWAGEVQIGDATVYNGFFKSNNSAYESMKTIFDEYNKRGIKYDAKLYPIFDAAVTAETFGRSPELAGIKDELTRLIAQARIDINGENVIVPSEDNKGGWGYSSAEIEAQKAKVAAVSNSAGNMDVSKDPGVIAAREALKETQKEMEGNVERQRAAEAESALKEREEAVQKELGEEGVGRITKALEGFYDLDKVSENRRRGLIAAAGEYITKMGMSIDQFEKVIQTLIGLYGIGGGRADMYSEKSNIEMYANLANEDIRRAAGTLNSGLFKGGFQFSITDEKGDTITKTLSRQKDGSLQTRVEQLQELAQVLNALSPKQAQSVREQFVSRYGLEATENIEKALNVINNRSDGIDFTEEKNMYARNADAETAFGKLSQYEQENLGAALRLERLDDTDEMKEAVAGGVFGSAGSKAVLPIIKTGSYRGAFGNTIDTLQTYQPEDQKDFSTATRNAATMFGIVNKMNTTELNKKMRFYGINADEMTNMEKLQALKGKEGASGVQSVLMKAIKYQLSNRKDLSEIEKISGLKQLDKFTGKFAEWIKAPENAAEKPMLYSVVQANIQGMLATFKQFAENRNRVILDRRAKAEKDAKAAEEAKKKEAGEDVEGRLKKVQEKLDDLAGCVDTGKDRLKIDLGYA